MLSRDEYVQKLKAQIDEWNAEAARWEERSRSARDDMQGEFRRQIDLFRAKSAQALAELEKLQRASFDALSELMRGADKAMQDMKDAFDRARREFDRK